MEQTYSEALFSFSWIFGGKKTLKKVNTIICMHACQKNILVILNVQRSLLDMLFIGRMIAFYYVCINWNLKYLFWSAFNVPACTIIKHNVN